MTKRLILIALGAALSMPLSASTITLVAAGTAATSSSGGTGSVTINSTGANLVVICAVSHSTDPAFSTDSANTIGSYSAGTSGNGGSKFVRCWYKFNPTTSSTHQVQITSVSFGHVWFSAWANAVTSPADGASTGFAASTTLAPGSITPTQDNDLILGGCFADDASGATVTGGLGNIATSTNAFNAGVFAYLAVQSPAAAINPTWTKSGSLAGAAFVLAFKGGTAGGSGSTIRHSVKGSE